VIFLTFSCVVYLFLPTNSFMGCFSSMVCSFISSHQTLPSTSPALSHFVNRFYGSNPIFSSGSSSFGSVPGLLCQRNLN
jgi:hypothetical protein